MDRFKKNEILNLYGEWIKYYEEVNKDPDFDYEHKEPNGSFYNLSEFEMDTIRRMAMVDLGEAFD